MAKQDRITIGAWTWDPVILKSKIIPGKPSDCWGWSGSTSPHANLFGAYKNNRSQMTQANRLLWMTETGEDATDLEIRHACGNRFCSNIQHMYVKPNHMNRPKIIREPGPPAKKFLPVLEKIAQEKTKEKSIPWWKL